MQISDIATLDLVIFLPPNLASHTMRWSWVSLCSSLSCKVQPQQRVSLGVPRRDCTPPQGPCRDGPAASWWPRRVPAEESGHSVEWPAQEIPTKSFFKEGEKWLAAQCPWHLTGEWINPMTRRGRTRHSSCAVYVHLQAICKVIIA